MGSMIWFAGQAGVRLLFDVALRATLAWSPRGRLRSGHAAMNDLSDDLPAVSVRIRESARGTRGDRREAGRGPSFVDRP